MLVFAIFLNIISVGTVAFAYQYWKNRKAEAEAEADNDFEFLRSVQRRYGFSDYNLSRLCCMYYDTELIPEEKRRDSQAIYITYSFYLAERLYNSKDEKEIEIETGLKPKSVYSEAFRCFRKENSLEAKANVIDYILVRENLYSIKQHNEAFEAFLKRPRGYSVVRNKLKVSYSTEEYQNHIRELCDSSINNPKCLLLQMENKI